MDSEPMDGAMEDLVVLLPALLRTLEALAFVSRFFNPPEFAAVMEAAKAPDEDLRAARPRLDAWPDHLAGMRRHLAQASDLALGAFEGLRAAEDLRAVFRALGGLPRAREALYPLTAGLPPVSGRGSSGASRASRSASPRRSGSRKWRLTGGKPAVRG